MVGELIGSNHGYPLNEGEKAFRVLTMPRVSVTPRKRGHDPVILGNAPIC